MGDRVSDYSRPHPLLPEFRTLFAISRSGAIVYGVLWPGADRLLWSGRS